MCGIIGTVPIVDIRFFEKALNLLKHRGADDYGISVIDNQIILGHRRLSIIDLTERAKQPFCDEAQRYWLVYNGEIYNYLELREELIKKGYRFRTVSDTEVLLYSFIEWGIGCLFKFNGMWAFAIWDNHERKLFLCRDRFGKKPLFYAFVDDRFVFASEMKAIFPFLKEVRPSKHFHFCHQNIFSYENKEFTLIDGIYKILPGHFAVYKDGKLIQQRYWNTLDHLVEPPDKYDEQVEIFRELFFDACKIRLRADVPIATALSGGLDSSSVVSAISNLQKDKSEKGLYVAFISSFPNSAIDEKNYAIMLCDANSVKYKVIEVDPLKYWDKLLHYLYLFEEIYLNPPVSAMILYGEMQASGIKVTIDGHGADELFSGYGHVLEALCDAKLDLKQASMILDTYLGTISNSENYKIKKLDKISLYTKFILRKMIKKLLQKDHFKDTYHPSFKKMDNLTKSLYLIFHETILPTLLRNFDRSSMANGVEIRMPFMDYRIVSFVFSLPYTSKIGNSYTKYLLRSAISPYMPSEITWRKWKVGWNAPIVDWMQKELRNWFLDLVNSREFMECELIENPSSTKSKVELIAHEKSSDWSIAEKAWTELMPFLWQKALIKSWKNYLHQQ